MTFLWRVTSFVQRLRHRTKAEDDLNDEIKSYIDEFAEKQVAAGLSPVEARRLARLKFGGAEQIAEHVREARFGVVIENFWRDGYQACRTWKRSLGFALTAIFTLALGIGANAALFTVLKAVLLRPLDYPQPERIVAVTRSWNEGSFKNPAVSAAKFDFWSRLNHSFLATAACNFLPSGMNLRRGSNAMRLTSLPVSADFFRVLGVNPLLGRSFRASEDRPGAGHFAVISYRMWHRFLNADPGLMSHNLFLNGELYTVLGVMPESFSFPVEADVWTPLQLEIDGANRSNRYRFIARLKPGVSRSQAEADMKLIGHRFRGEFGTDAMSASEGIAVVDFHAWTVGNVRPVLLLMMGAVGFVLLIVCANVAGLMLARGAARRQELVLRAALGASTARLISAVVAESLCLSSLGAVLALPVACIALPLLLQLAPVDVPLVSRATVDGSVLLFCGALALLTGILFALVPSLQHLGFGGANQAGANHPGANRAQDAGVRVAGSLSALRGRQFLVVAQISLAVVLLVGGSLLVRTMRELNAVQPGFDTTNVLTLQMSLTADKFRETATTTRLAEQVITRLEGTGAVETAAVIDALPTMIGPDMVFEFPGRTMPENTLLDQPIRTITPHYFAALRIPLLAGRLFTNRDRAEAPGVLIVNQAFARKYFPRQSPLGQQILIGRKAGPMMLAERPRVIVGVVGDTHDGGLNNGPPPILFQPLAQVPDGLMAMQNQMDSWHWVFRTRHDSLAAVDSIRREVLKVSDDVPVDDPKTLGSVVGSSLARQRFTMSLLTIFSAQALLLCAIGLYGLISYTVTQRTRELGIRAALGANQQHLLWLILRDGLKLLLLGLIVGLPASFLLSRLLQELLFGVSVYDFSVLSTVLGLLTAVSLLACYFPGRRAAHTDPAMTLRAE